ncbi:MAG: hypothetical protein ACR2PI_26060 [Hyphomicrobiaceae bacterium]
MRDRRGHGNQAYLSQTEDTEMTPSKGGYMPAVDEGGSVGAAPTPISSTPEKTPEPAPELADMSASASPSAPSAAAPVAEMMPDMADDQSSNGSSSNPSQGIPAADAPAAPTVDAQVPITSAAAPAASASAPMATGGAAPSNSYTGDDMGWDAAAFAEAGGYDAVLTGALPPGMCPGDGDGQDVFIFIDELNVDIINNTLIQETEINLIADDGSVIDIGGDFTAIQTQESLIQDGPIPGATGPADAAFIPQETAFIEADNAGMA